jgi:hypothetical protein
MGRKTKLTPEVHQAVVGALRLGASVRLATKHAGIGATTYHSWLKRGEREDGPYREFGRAVQAARGQLAAQLRALDGATLAPAAPIEALHARWAEHSPDGYVTIESPGPFCDWLVSFVSVGPDKPPTYRFEGPTFADATTQAAQWLALRGAQ